MTNLSLTTDFPSKVSFKQFVPKLAPMGSDNVIVISDVHLGHGRVKSSVIIDYLEHVLRPEVLEVTRAVVISGDLFDKRLSFDSEDAFTIGRYLDRLTKSCARFKVSLILLEGTPSHDNRQSRWLLHYNAISNHGADVRYYEKIEIDYLYEGGPLTLFIPDEVNHDATKTWKQVVELMELRGVDQVDVAVMHGMFTFQEPVRSVSSHLEERYESIVKHLIIIGHHHKPARFGKIRVPGSPERLRYNEEHDKGHYQFTFSLKEGVIDEVFVVNDEATVFTTYPMVGKTYAEIETLLKTLDHLPDGSHLRFEMSRNDEAYPALAKLRAAFPQFDISAKPIEAHMPTENTDHLVDTPVMTSIRPDNLSELLLSRVTDEPDEVMMAMKKILAGT